MWIIYKDDTPRDFSTLETDEIPEVEAPFKTFFAESTPFIEGKMVDIENLCLMEAPPLDPEPDTPEE